MHIVVGTAGGGRGPEDPESNRVIERLQREDLLPVITFIFSRKGCDAAAEACVAGDCG